MKISWKYILKFTLFRSGLNEGNIREGTDILVVALRFFSSYN